MKGESTAATRIGFAVDDVARACAAAGRLGTILTEPVATEWGMRAVLVDPAGHKVELVGKR